MHIVHTMLMIAFRFPKKYRRIFLGPLHIYTHTTHTRTHTQTRTLALSLSLTYTHTHNPKKYVCIPKSCTAPCIGQSFPLACNAGCCADALEPLNVLTGPPAQLYIVKQPSSTQEGGVAFDVMPLLQVRMYTCVRVCMRVNVCARV